MHGGIPNFAAGGDLDRPDRQRLLVDPDTNGPLI
jgi:hypothetical protein